MISVAVVGAGFGGVGAAAMLTRAGYSEVRVFERGERIGGVWHHNTYPGAACDVPSHMYEFSFAPNPRWSHRYASQAEIQAYLEDVAQRSGMRDRIHTGTEVREARWDEERETWRLDTSAGPHEADVLITACGQLAVPSVPLIPGLERFAGPVFHAACWRHDVELSGQRVGVVGTGCSAIQVVPAIQPVVDHLDVYQRSPGRTIPRMDFAYSQRAQRLFERVPVLQRLDREAKFAFHEFAALAMTSQLWILAFRALGRYQINAAIKDPELRRQVTPVDEVGCKRVMVTDDWYRTLAKPNVDLVSEQIVEVTEGGVRTADDRDHATDVLVLATGFHTHGFVAPMEIIGAGGRALADEWSPVPRAYLGLSVPGFPNLFLLYGPNTNGGSGSVIYTLESGIGHVIAALGELERARARTIEVRREAAEAFDRRLRGALSDTVWHTGCTSWYLDEQGNDPNEWPWLWSAYRRRTAKLTPGAYKLAGRRAGSSETPDAKEPDPSSEHATMINGAPHA